MEVSRAYYLLCPASALIEAMTTYLWPRSCGQLHWKESSSAIAHMAEDEYQGMALQACGA